MEREYPNLCSILHPLTQLDQDKFCKNNAWDIPRKSLPNCNNRKCPMEDAILGKYIIRLDGGLKYNFFLVQFPDSVLQSSLHLYLVFNQHLHMN